MVAPSLAPVSSLPIWRGKHISAASLYCLIAVAAKCSASLLPKSAENPQNKAACIRCAARFARAFAAPEGEIDAIAKTFASAASDSTKTARYVDILLRIGDASPAETALRLLAFIDDGRLPFNHPVFFAYGEIAELLLGARNAQASAIISRHFITVGNAALIDGKKDVIKTMARCHPDKYALHAAPPLFAKDVNALYARCAEAYKQGKASDRRLATSPTAKIKSFFIKKRPQHLQRLAADSA